MARKRQGKLLGGMLPAIVWLAAVGGVIFLYTHRHRTFKLIGLAIAPAQTLSAADNGIVRNIPVSLFQPVKRGDLLAIVELGSPTENNYLKALTEARKNTAMAELDRLKAEMNAVSEQLRFERGVDADNLRLRYGQLAMDVENAHLELLKIRTELELDRGLLAGLELERNAVRELLNKEAVHPYEMEKADLEYTALARKIAAAEEQEKQAQAYLDVARRRLGELTVSEQDEAFVQTLLEPHRKALAVQEKLLAEIFTPTSQMRLTAQIDGIVSAIFTAEGQGIQAGDIILTVVPEGANYVIAWLDPMQAGRIQSSQSVDITKHSHPQQIIHSRVDAISPAVELMPEQMWRNPSMPQWGRPVKIAVPTEMELAGNEIVGVQFR